MIKDFRDLVVWQNGIEIVDEVYRVTKEFPKAEMYGLISQFRRAAISVPSNIAEGHGRSGKNEYLHHLSIAHGSLMECLTLAVISNRQEFIAKEPADNLIIQIEALSRKIRTLMLKLKK